MSKIGFIGQGLRPMSKIGFVGRAKVVRATNAHFLL